MVILTRKKYEELLCKVEVVQAENKKLWDSIKAINKKVNKIKKDEKTEKEENDKINDWLTDSRIDEVQEFLHKGGK